MAASTWTWLGVTSAPNVSTNWTLTSGAGNATNVPQAGDTAIFNGSGQTPQILDSSITGLTLDLAGSSTLQLLNDGSIGTGTTIAASSLIDATGTATTLVAAGPVTNDGMIEVTGGAGHLAITITADGLVPGSLTNAGTIAVNTGDALTIATAGSATFTDPGAVFVDGGSALISGNLTGLDNFAISQGGSLQLNQSDGAALPFVTFSGSGTLTLVQPSNFSGNISGFGVGDTLDLGPVNIATVVFDGSGDITAIGSDGQTVFTAQTDSGPLGGNGNQGTFTLSGTGGLAGALEITEGNGGDTVLTVAGASTWAWKNGASASGETVADWNLISGPGNGFGSPQSGDTAINANGTILLGAGGQLNGNTVDLGGTAGVAALLFGAGGSGASLASPSIDGNSVVTSVVPGNTTAETSLLGTAGSFVNAGSIDAAGPTGSSFTIAVSSTTANGTLQPGDFINYGEIEVDAGNSMTIATDATSALFNLGKIVVNGGLALASGASGMTISGTGASNGSLLVENDGTLNVASDGSGPAVYVSATGSAAASATVTGPNSLWTLSASTGQFVVGGDGRGSLTVTNGGGVDTGSSTVDIGASPGGQGTVLVGGAGAFVHSGGLSIANGQNATGPLTINTGGTVQAVGLTEGSGGSIILAGGSLVVLTTGGSAGDTITAGPPSSAGTISGFGTFSSIDQLTSTGIVIASGGTLDFIGGMTGTGHITIDGGATFRSDGQLGDAQSVSFANSSTAASLMLGSVLPTSNFALTNWQIGDELVFMSGATVIGAGWLGNGTLAVNTTAGTLDLTNVSLAAGAAPVFTTGANFVELVSCFAAGTRITTARGQLRVQDLRKGDLIQTMFAGRFAPIVWIGHREVNCARHPKPCSVWPMRVAANAFGPGLPQTDLMLSPDHAIYVNDVLIPVKQLENERSIVQVPVDRVTYFHIELPRHDVVLAEGLAVESYLDVGDRSNFANGGGTVALFPNFTVLKWETEGCAPLVVTGPEVQAAQEVLNQWAAAGRAAA